MGDECVWELLERCWSAAGALLGYQSAALQQRRKSGLTFAQPRCRRFSSSAGLVGVISARNGSQVVFYSCRLFRKAQEQPFARRKTQCDRQRGFCRPYSCPS